MSRELVIYTDESEKNGKFFANFYGGALVRSSDLDRVRDELHGVATALGLTAEIKWQKVSSGYLHRYIDLMTAFFRIVAEGRIKIRIMFTQKAYVLKNLSIEQRENEFFLLYYQFIKHAFGIAHCNDDDEPIRLRINLDQLPDTRESAARFKGFLAGLQQSPGFRTAQVLVPADQIAEISSHEHIILQCLDVVLGAMQFRLNDGHLIKPEGSARRGNRTIAKEKLYKHINQLIRGIHPGFNIGISTGTDGNRENHWHHPYRHWLFVPNEAQLDRSKTKRK
jgi:hypothetical protein